MRVSWFLICGRGGMTLTSGIEAELGREIIPESSLLCRYCWIDSYDIVFDRLYYAALSI